MTSLTRNQQFALASAVIYLLVGASGFLVTGFDDFAGDTDEKLLIFGVNPLHNIVHFVFAGAWFAASRTAANAKLGNIALGGALLAAFVVGMFGGGFFLNIDNAAEPDNYLHLIYGALSLYVGLKIVDDPATNASPSIS